MSKSQTFIYPAFLATKEKLRDRFLFVGKVVDDSNPQKFLFYLIEILSPWFPSTKVEKIITQSLENNFKSTDFSLAEFEQTLREINESLGLIAQEGESDWIGNLNSLIGLVDNDQLHITLTGNISGYLIRKNKISSITDGLSSDLENAPFKSFVNITSGELALGDRIIITNLSLYNYLSIDRLRTLVEKLPARSAIFEIHRGLRRIRVREAAAIILESTDLQLDPKLKDLPEIVYLDQAAKSWLEKSVEKATPIAKTIYSGLASALKKSAQKSKHAAALVKNRLDQRYGRKEKQLSFDDKDNLERAVGQDHPAAAKNKFSISKIKINPYAKKTAGALGWIGRLLAKIIILFKKENRRYLYAVLVVLLIVGGYLKIRSNNINQTKTNQEQQATASLNEANDLLNSANEDIATKKGDGKDKLLKALDITKQAEQFVSTHDRAVELMGKIQDKIDEIIGAVRFRNLKVAFSINGDISRSVLSGTKIYSITRDGKIYLTDTLDKEPQLVASIGSDGSKVVDLTYSNSMNMIFIYLDSQKVLTLDTTNDTVGKAEMASDKNKNWEKGVALKAYNTNLYLLDPESGEVWKHSQLDNGFSDGADYLNTTKVSLKNSVDLTIDGNIYLLNNDGSVVKFTRSAYEQDFQIKAIPSPYDKLAEPKAIFTDQDTNYIYIFDKGENRIVRYDKTGEYSTQYYFEGINIDQFLVNTRVQKMWVTSGKDVYEVSI